MDDESADDECTAAPSRVLDMTEEARYGVVEVAAVFAAVVICHEAHPPTTPRDCDLVDLVL